MMEQPLCQNMKAKKEIHASIYIYRHIALTSTTKYSPLHQRMLILLMIGKCILWKSGDGIHFDRKEQGFYPVEKYLGKEKLKNAVNHYAGNIIKFERPQLLLIDGEPAYLYATSGFNFFGGESTASYVLKYVK